MSPGMAVDDSASLFPEFKSDAPPPVPPSAPAGAVTPPPAQSAAIPVPPSGQLILGADKRNPLLSVYHDEANKLLIVYYGFEILETLPDDPQGTGYKLLLGRLYNARAKLCTLCQVFDVDPKTLRRWGQALKSSPAEMVRILEGRFAARKCTVEIGSFIRVRWPDLLATRSYGAVKRLQAEIKAVFDVSLSRSALRPILKKLENPSSISQVPESGLPQNGTLEKGETPANCSEPNDPPSPEIPNNPAATPPLPAPPPAGNNAQGSPFFPNDPAPSSYWCEHAGLLIFAATLKSMVQVSASPQDILAQWLAAFWLGAPNIEQTKFLNWEDLELILGPRVRYPTEQREKLHELSCDPQLLQSLFRFNQKQLGENVGTDFYFDPHVKHYTGEQNVLKGWCPKIRFADKIMQSDFIHTTRGAPIYFETTDNFADLRERFFAVVKRARVALNWPLALVLTQVVDRGIFGDEVFEQVIADPYLHLITWEKGYIAGPWDPQLVTGKTVITRYRNSSKDLHSCQFEYFERPWEGNPKMRQIVVQATDRHGRQIQVSILTDDGSRNAEEIVQLMFRRWVQENDFKYLDQHFGINQITSYRSVDYEKLKGQIEDREVKSGARKALDQQLKLATRALARELLAEEHAAMAHTRRQKKSQELSAQLAQLPEGDTPDRTALQRKLNQLNRANERYELTRVKRRERITQCHAVSDQVKKKIETTAATESRLEAMIQADMVKLEPQSKRLMDILRITARNGFYAALQPFKKDYDNYRDDHEHFRRLTQSPGVLEVSENEVLVHLFPRANYGGELRGVVERTLNGLNEQKLEHPKLPGRRLRFRLAHRSELDLKVRVGQ